MSIETAEETTTDVVVDAEAQAAAAAALATADAEGKSSEVTDKDETSTDDDADADEVVVTIGDTAPPQEDAELEQAPAWVKELRKTNREQAKRIRELEKTTQQQTQQTTETVVGAEPKMSDPDIDYDSEKFKASWTAWNERKRVAAEETSKKQTAERKAQESWQERLNGYNEAKTKLKVKDYSEAEATAVDALSQIQQGIVVQGAENPALVIYALGKNTAKLKELSSITDPVKFAFAVAKLERDLKVTTRKTPPPPEKTVTGSAPKSGVVDSQLEKLRADAEKTGDFSKVVAYKRSKRAAS